MPPASSRDYRGQQAMERQYTEPLTIAVGHDNELLARGEEHRCGLLEKRTNGQLDTI
jgi:hypothetical protein